MISQRRFLPAGLLTAILVLLFSVTCTHNPDLSDFPEVCFTGEVFPVFLNNCSMAGCHDGSGESDYTFGSYSEIMNGITPGNAEKSEIYQAIISKWGNRMPPDKPLSETDRIKLRVWIEQGAAETTCTQAGGSGNDSIPILLRKAVSRITYK